MRIVRFVDAAGQTRYGTDYANGTAELLSGDPFTSGGGSLKREGKRVEVKKLLAPVEARAIICIGLNYKKHAEETGATLPEFPVMFMKNPAALNHPESPIVIPKSCQAPNEQVDFEVELAVVIGKAASGVPKDKALDHVLGYTIGNDVSARLWQKHKGMGGQWVRGKSFDTFCPLGPAIVTTDELRDPQKLKIETKVNGQVMQSDNTSDMIFSVADLIAFLSDGMTLLPGTVILTGTPSGVGVARKPQVFLKQGDVVEQTIEGIGTLRNPVVHA
jgi:2-keto-4-pentenoate hydratase/2-oxohepta-3-ene-1,7-dioic acid hydratase in catechol pathway